MMQKAIVVSGEGYVARVPGGYYSILQEINPQLLVDVGAAAGAITAKLAKVAPHAVIHVFEPFPGNWPFLDAAIAGNEKIVAHKIALSDQAGESLFYVPGTVKGTEPGWEKLKGYSSGGKLVSNPRVIDERCHTVRTERLDDILDCQIDFMKIDVQGGESRVLRGASRLLEKAMVKLMYVEFDGSIELLDALVDNDFVIMYDFFLVCPMDGEADLSEFDIAHSINMSNGQKGYRGWPKAPLNEVGELSDFVSRKRDNIRAVQTDLLCMHRAHIDEILSAMGRRIERKL